MSPFEVDLGWKPKSVLDVIAADAEPVQSVAEFTIVMKQSLDDAKFSYKMAKARQSAHAGKGFVPHSYYEGDLLWINRSLFKDAYSRSQVSDKLTSRRVGPYAVKKLIGKNAVKLDLPSHFQIHDVVNVVHTTP